MEFSIKPKIVILDSDVKSLKLILNFDTIKDIAKLYEETHQGCKVFYDIHKIRRRNSTKRNIKGSQYVAKLVIIPKELLSLFQVEYEQYRRHFIMVFPDRFKKLNKTIELKV